MNVLHMPRVSRIAVVEPLLLSESNPCQEIPWQRVPTWYNISVNNVPHPHFLCSRLGRVPFLPSAVSAAFSVPPSHNPFTLTLLPDPLTLTPTESNFCENHGGRGAVPSSNSQLWTISNHPLSFLGLTRSFSQRALHISFGINSLCTLFIATGGVPLVPFWISPQTTKFASMAGRPKQVHHRLACRQCRSAARRFSILTAVIFLFFSFVPPS